MAAAPALLRALQQARLLLAVAGELGREPIGDWAEYGHRPVARQLVEWPIVGKQRPAAESAEQGGNVDVRAAAKPGPSLCQGHVRLAAASVAAWHLDQPLAALTFFGVASVASLKELL